MTTTPDYFGQGVLAWRGVEFWAFPSSCVVAVTTLSHYRAGVWFAWLRCSRIPAYGPEFLKIWEI